MQRRSVTLLLWIVPVCAHLSSAFQKSEGRYNESLDVGAQGVYQASHDDVYNRSSLIETINATTDGSIKDVNAKRYLIEIQDRQQAVKLANPIVDLEDSVRRGINDPLADPRFIMNRINDDYFDSRTNVHNQPRSTELMNYQNRDRFTSTSLGGNRHMFRPLTPSRPQQQNAIKEELVSKQFPITFQQHFSQFPDIQMAIQNSQQLPGLGAPMQMAHEQIQTFQRQPVSQLSNIALGGQMSTGMPAFSMPRQQSSSNIGNIGSISILRQSNSELPMINFPRLSSTLTQGLTLPGQQSNMLSNSAPLQRRPPQVLDFNMPSQSLQQEIAQQNGIALASTLPSQLRDLGTPQQEAPPPIQSPDNRDHPASISIQSLNNPVTLSMHSPARQGEAEVEHHIPGSVRTAELTEVQQSESDKLESELRSLQNARNENMNIAHHSRGNQAIKAHRKQLDEPRLHRFASQNQARSQKNTADHLVNKDSRRFRTRDNRPPQQRLKKHREKEMNGIDELTGLPDDLERNNAGTGVSSITAISDPAPQPSSVTVDTGEDATQIGDMSSKSHSKEPQSEHESHDTNTGTRDLLNSLRDEGVAGGGSLSSIKEYLEADNMLRTKLNKDNIGTENASEKNNELSESDLSSDKPLNIGADGENYEGEKANDRY